MPFFHTPYGSFDSNDMKRAVMASIKALIANPNEDVLYFHKQLRQFNNCRWSDEHLPELRKWKAMKLHSYQCNRKEIQCGRHKVFVNVYQPENDDASMSILSIGLGTMVDGITYVYKKKSHADTAHKMLEKEFVRTQNEFLFGKPEHDDPENATEPQKWTLDFKGNTYPKKRKSKKKGKKGKKKK